MQELHPLIKNLMGFAQKRFGFQNPPKLFFKQDQENAKNVLGKTAFYDPQEQSVTIFTTNRHPKDVLRSLAHELVHHTQNLRGDFNSSASANFGPGYAQENPDLRELEREAYEQGNLCFRDWEDGYKKQLQEVKFLKESKKMTKKITKKTLEGLIRRVLSEQTLPDMSTGMMLFNIADKVTKGLKAQSGALIGQITRTAGEENPGVLGAIDKAEMDEYFKDNLRDEYMRKAMDAAYKKDRGANQNEDVLANAAAERFAIKFTNNFPRLQDGMEGQAVRSMLKPIVKREIKKAAAKVLRKAIRDRVAAAQAAVDVTQAANIIDSPMGPHGKPETEPLTDKEIKRKGRQQMRFLRRIRVKSIEQLRGLVGMEKPAGSIEAGRYDKELHDAIMQFQREVGAKPDGVVGPATVTAAQMKAKTKTFYEPWNSLRGSRRRKKRVYNPAALRRALNQPEVVALTRTNESIDPLGEGSGCGSPGKRDVQKKVVLDEERGVRMVNGKCEQCTRDSRLGKCHMGKTCEQLEESLQEQMTDPDAPMSVSAKPDFPDVDGDGDTKEPISQAQKQKKEKKGDDSKKKSAKPKKGEVPPQLRKHVEKKKKGQNESKIYTPEQEQSLYESRFNNRNQQIFDKLKKLWTK